MNNPSIKKKGKKNSNNKKRKREDNEKHKQMTKKSKNVNNNVQSSSKKTTKNVVTKSKLQEKFKAKLESGQFRWLNEKLYTTTSDEAVELFKKHPKWYQIYHKGFEFQVEKWPENPVQVIIKLIKKMPKDYVIGDFGCGNAMIAQSVVNKVHSFDLCKTNKYVKVANSANLPLDDGVLDVGVFCLSLMGTDFLKFIREARRVLKPNGTLIVAEVKSRFGKEDTSKTEKEESMLGGIASFNEALKKEGFKLVHSSVENTMFVLFQYKKNKKVRAAQQQDEEEQILLKSCKYKKR